jgi:hypothetical protein
MFGSMKPKKRRAISSSTSLTNGTAPMACARFMQRLDEGLAGTPPLISKSSLGWSLSE